MNLIDTERVSRVQERMIKAEIDVLVCSLPENVAYLTGYWPVMGNSTVVFPASGDATVLLPHEELDYAVEGWVSDLRTFKFIRMDRLPDPIHDKIALMRSLWTEKGYAGTVVGYEGSFELVAGNNVAAEARVPTPKSAHAYIDAFPQSTWLDATDLIKRCRIVKSRAEIAQLRITSEVACIGLEAAREAIAEGVSEAEIAGAVEGRIYGHGIGYKNVTRARGYCFVMSGPNSVNSWRPFCVSSAKRLQPGEPVLVELDAVTNAYFIDITRTFFVGELDARAKEIFDVVQEATNAAIAAAKPGVRGDALDAIARNVIVKAGYGEYFPHQLGHGIGLQFHEPPTLHPASKDVLEAGMTCAVEPAIYLPGFGGVRLEENIVITETGAERITPYPQRVESLREPVFTRNSHTLPPAFLATP